MQPPNHNFGRIVTSTCEIAAGDFLACVCAQTSHRHFGRAVCVRGRELCACDCVRWGGLGGRVECSGGGERETGRGNGGERRKDMNRRKDSVCEEGKEKGTMIVRETRIVGQAGRSRA